MDTYVTVAGNLTGDPDPRNTAAGLTVVNLRIASNTRRYDKDAGAFKDGDTLYINVTCWRTLGTNVAASLRKGDSVIVTGRLIYREYEDRDGNTRRVHEIDAASVGPDLSRWAVDVRRPARPSDEPQPAPTSEVESAAAA